MKSEYVYLFLQPKEEYSFWTDRILEGIRQGVKETGGKLFVLDQNRVLPDLRDRNVLVAGSQIDWLQNTVSLLLEKEAHPIIVNACMLPFRSLRCSGVVFELEEILESCLNGLKEKGKKRIALLGVGRDSAADRAKVDAFTRTAASFEKGDIIWAESNFDALVESFLSSLPEEKYDAVICANDTVAIQLLKAKKTSHIDIIGIGNSYVGAFLGLTSICFNYFEMGKAAVSLYYTLSQKKSPCHMILSLPCYLENRDSAGISLPRHLPPKLSPSPDDRFHHPKTQNILRVEAMLQNSDDIDRAILYGIARGENTESIAAKLYFSDRAVRYRLTKLVNRYGFSGRLPLEEALKSAFFSQ